MEQLAEHDNAATVRAERIDAYAKAAVTAGAEWFDAEAPDWFTRVDADRLDVGNLTTCPMAQVFGDWDEGAHVAATSTGLKGGAFRRWRAEHGFDTWGGDEVNAPTWTTPWDLLDDLWREAIQERRSTVDGQNV